MSQKQTKIIYTDGSCPSNGKADAIGGWAWVEVDGFSTEANILNKGSGRSEINKEQPNTSIRMELLAIIEALSSFKEPCLIYLRSDSAYCINGLAQKWYKTWFRTGLNSSGKKPANMDLWRRLVALVEFHDVRPEHIRGHKGHVFQEMCDKMAVAQSRGE